MKKKLLKTAIVFAMPVVAFLLLGVFFVSGISSGFVSAVSGNGGGFFVRSSSKLELNGGTIISGNTATNGGGVYVESDGNLTLGKINRIDADGNEDPNGDYILFGSYPKTYQSDESVITTTQDENGYYLGTDGNRYAKVSANPYDPSYVFNDGTTIVSGTIYYFKVEPIKWRILKTENGKALLLCEDIITAMWFDDSTSQSNNYANSEIRAYLNGLSTSYGSSYLDNGFLQTAFTTAEQNSILTTEVKNDASTTESSSNTYICENTNDKIFLLSYQDMINTEYGFSSSYSEYDTARQKQTTDYARANYAKIDSNGAGIYWLRSPSISSSSNAYRVYFNGQLSICSVAYSYRGVVPALYVLESVLQDSTSSISGNTATSGNGHDVYNAGTFTMISGTIGTSGSSKTGYGIYNTGTMNLFGGTIYDSIYSSTTFLTKMGASIIGTITLGDNAKIVVKDYAGTTPPYNISVLSSRTDKTIMTLQGSSTAPDLTKLNIVGYDSDSYNLEIVQGSSSNEWNVVLEELIMERDFPSTWKTEVASTDHMTTTVAPTDLTSIMFETSVPSGYVKIGRLSTGLNVYQSSTTSTAIAFVNKGIIYAPKDSSFLFTSGLTTLTFNNFDTSKVIDMHWMFSDCSKLTSLNVREFNTSNVTNMRYMFSNCSKLKSLDVSGFDTSNVTDISGMFRGCSGLKNLNLSNFATSRVTNTEYMFNNCSNLTNINVGGFNTSNVTNMRYMFNNCSSLISLDVSGFDTKKVTKMDSMFDDCSSLTSLDVGGFNTSNVTDMSSMFYYCSSLTSLDVSGFDTSNVTDMKSMFVGCSKLKNLNVSNFNTSNVINMYAVFSACSNLTSLDVSKFDTLKVTDMERMFNGCSSLTTLDLSSFDMSKVTKSTAMLAFGSSGSLKYLKTPKNNTSALTITNGSTLYNISTGSSVSSVPANTTESLTLKARYTVTFNANGGTCSTSSKYVYYDTEIGELPTATREGYNFLGWFTESSGGTQISDSTKVESSKTFYAHWSAVYVRVDASGKEDENGNYVLFGSYPKTIKSSSVTIDTSNVDSNGYYLGSDGERYASLVANVYSDEWNNGTYYFSNGQAITNGTTYYFKLEPIKWKILTESNGTAFIVASDFIDSRNFDDEYSSSNNYANSEIRAWLNGYSSTFGSSYLNNGFLQNYFTDYEQSLILTTLVDNSASTTIDAASAYVCANTNDKIFLLSYSEVTNSSYGFNSDYSVKETARQRIATDWARANYSFLNSSYGWTGYWWTRSPSSGGSYVIRVNYAGYALSGDYATFNAVGVVPAMRISGLKAKTSSFASSQKLKKENNGLNSNENIVSNFAFNVSALSFDVVDNLKKVVVLKNQDLYFEKKQKRLVLLSLFDEKILFKKSYEIEPVTSSLNLIG